MLLLLTQPESGNALFTAVDIGLPVLTPSGSEFQISLLQNWLKVCDERHYDHGCDQKEEKILPKRVLDVGVTNTPENLRLRITTSGEKGRYMALSHRWGSGKPIRTTTHNLDLFRQNINFTELTKTFQDAVTITRKLGLRYLWIDSLCIIQEGDGMRDWEEQSQLMEGIFASAYCTIAATNTVDPSQGFLGPRLGKRFIKLPTPVPLYVSKLRAGFSEDVEQGELNKRAWVLQERALSPRIIHFVNNGPAYWECGSVIRDEHLFQTVRYVGV